MIIRENGDSVIVISQPVHAGVSSQVASAWGNRAFGTIEPFDGVFLAALLHDIGWIDWEQAPTLNPETGLPHSFLQLGTRVHLGIWDRASARALAFGRYPALLTSMHFTALYEQYHDYSRDSEDDARDARALVAREVEFQQAILATLRADPATVDHASDEIVGRNQRLVALWDGMSLAICHGVTEPRTFRGVPAAEGSVDLVLAPVSNGLSVDPWPFGAERVVVHADGRLLSGRFEEQHALNRALADAPWTTVEAVLAPAG